MDFSGHLWTCPEEAMVPEEDSILLHIVLIYIRYGNSNIAEAPVEAPGQKLF
jgi:hypothetical protein